MTFKEKIDAIINDNPFGIGSVNALEIYLGTGNGGILRICHDPVKKPTIKMVMRITEGLGINMTWWKTGKGNLYKQNDDPVRLLKRLIHEQEEQIKLLNENRALYERLLLERDIESITLNLRLNDKN